MTSDEQAIRSLIDTWMNASMQGDTKKVLSLMTDDVVFMVAGQEPFGKEAFAASSEQIKGVRIEGKSDVVEIVVSGDWAFARSRLEVAMTPPNGLPMKRSGHTLTIFRKMPNGSWLLARDANLSKAHAS